jgi:hypothetical protein
MDTETSNEITTGKQPLRGFAWKAGTLKNAVHLLSTRLRSQFTQLLEKVRSNEAGTHWFGSTIELTCQTGTSYL